MKNIHKVIIMPMVACLFSGFFVLAESPVYAAKKNAKMNVKIKKKIVIQNISDIDFGDFNPGTKPSKQTMSFCVGMNQRPSDRYYKIKASSKHQNGGQFRLLVTDNGDASNSNHVMPYSVTLEDVNGTTRSLEAGTFVDNNGNGFFTDSNLGCNHSDQTLKLEITDNNTLTNIAGDYQDTLTLLVAPI